MSRGILYIVWPGDPRTETMLARSIASVKRWHPELPIHVERLPEGATLMDKARMYDLSPFDETCFLDADTVVMGRLDFAFEKASRHTLATCICECPWARRFAGMASGGDVVEYNTGCLWFTRAAAPLFAAWKTWTLELDTSMEFHTVEGVKRMPCNDQAAFAAAVASTNFNPYVLPMNWNFRPLWQKSWFGPIRVWHDYSDPSASLAAFNAQQSEAGAVICYARLP